MSNKMFAQRIGESRSESAQGCWSMEVDMGRGSSCVRDMSDEGRLDDTENQGTDPDVLQSAGRILDVLLCFTKSKPDWSIAELAEELDLHRSVARRCVVTLASRGFLRQDPVDRRYRLGLVLCELGSVVLPAKDIVATSMPFMERLSRDTGSSVFLTVEAENQAVCIARVDSPKPLRVTFEVGRCSPLHAGASARVILAYLPEGRVEEIFGSGLRRFTDRTLADPATLVEELTRTRERGYSISTGELDEGVTAIGVPIKGGNGEVLASLSISGPTIDFTPERVPCLVEATLDCAERIRRQLFGTRS
jgi:IclR family KDG regulon transcriptional repressor